MAELFQGDGLLDFVSSFWIIVIFKLACLQDDGSLQIFCFFFFHVKLNLKKLKFKPFIFNYK